MEPYTKKRRLAPKLAEKPAHDQIPEQRRFEYPPPPLLQDMLLQQQQQQQPATAEHSDFERFARNVQDAASLICNQANRSQYSSVSVLLIRWEDDLSVEHDLLSLQKVFRQRYNYQTETWSIPSCLNPIAKLSIQLAQQIEYARPGHLLIVYYIGYSFVSSDHQLYWACNPREDSPRLKWEGIRCLLEDAQPDILLLLDCCGFSGIQTIGSNGVKQAIAAFGRENSLIELRPRMFTFNLVEALHQLSSGPPFTVQRLLEEIISQRHRRLEHPGLINGSSKFSPPLDRIPITFTLTPGTPKTILLAPLAPMRPVASQTASPLDSPDGDNQASGNGERSSSNNAHADLTFEEPRALVYISFPGDPSHEMASFKHRLNSTPATAAKVTVEGMFQGPPTLMLISMPIAVFNAIAGDRNCTLLGYIKSHNMLREYQKLLDVPTISSKAASKHLEDGKILLEAAEANAASPSVVRHESQLMPVMYQPIQPHSNLPPPPPPPTMSERPNAPERKGEVEDSDEMHEAAIQLKALSDVQPLSHDSQRNERSSSQIPHENSPSVRSHHDESGSSQEGGDSGAEENPYSSEYNSPVSARPKARRSIQKQGPKQDTRCSMCSHAPFKDSSSLRKHVAAAHTRPFPCAFSFAGCTSTFGSKNEWKRHIASQHLCLTYYRCSSCPQSTVEGKGNEFNRKDLFTQHLRRMHAPFAIKKAIAKGDSKLQLEWETHVKEMQTSCLVTRRCPPMRSACPKADCSNVFEGTGSWDDWTEHVGRHMEKGEASRLGVDRLLAKWALDEGIIERKEDGEYRLCGQEREGNGIGYHSDATTKREVDDKIEDTIMLDEPGR